MGTETYYVTETNMGCVSDSTALLVTINTTPSAPAADGDSTYCFGETLVNLTAVAGSGGTLTWYDDGGGGSIGMGASQAPVNAVGTETYYVTETVSGCVSDSTALTVVINATPSAPAADGDSTYCFGETLVNLTATAGSGGTLNWFNSGGALGSGATQAVTNAVGAETYYVSETLGSCVSDSTALLVTINTTPSAPAADGDSTYCFGETLVNLTATAGSGGTLNWFNSGGALGSGAGQAVTNAVGAETYYVSETLGSCVSDSTSLLVTINTTPSAPAAFVTA